MKKEKTLKKEKKFLEEIISGMDDRYLAEIFETEDIRNKEIQAASSVRRQNMDSRKQGMRQSRIPDFRIRSFTKYAGRAAVCLALTFVLAFSGVTAAAAGGSITAYDILHSMYPKFAEAMVPVRESCVYDGIEMRVEAVNVEGNKAEVYIVMQDLTGDRIDGTMDLFDSEKIGIGGDQIGSCKLVSFDAETKTATFLVTAMRMDGKTISRKSFRFSVSRFLCDKKEQTLEISGIDLKTAEEKENFLSAHLPAESEAARSGVTIRGTGNGKGKEKESGEAVYWRNDLKGCLIPEEKKQWIAATEGVNITAYGYINNRLHIQAYYEDISDRDDHGFLWITDSCGNETDYLYNVSFWDEDHKGSYEEYVFDLAPGTDLTGYSLSGWFVTGAKLYEGKWSVQITLPEDN